MNREIKIGGAGIAGLAAAINLRSLGYNVTVFEKKADVGGQHGDDWEGLENWTQEEDILDFLKRIKIGTGFYHKPCYRVNIFDSHNHKSVAEAKTPFLYLVKRGSYSDSLDQYLKKTAEDRGVKIEFNKNITPEEVDIVATGPISPPRGLGYGISFKTDLPDCLYAIMDNKLVPYGYGYLIVVDGQGTLAVALAKNLELTKEYFIKTIDRFKKLLQFQIKEPREFSGFINPAIIKNKEKIYIGEAAGLQDLFWGFGMRYAFLSASLAVQAIANNKNYWQLLREEIHPWMKASAANRLFLKLLRNIGLSWLIRKVGVSANQIKILRRGYSFTWYRKIAYYFIKSRYEN